MIGDLKMANLTLWSATKDVTSIISSMVSTFHTLRTIRKEDSIRLKNKIKALENVAKAEGLGEVARANIREITRTQELIDKSNLKGESLGFAMNQLEILNHMLEKNVKEFLK